MSGFFNELKERRVLPAVGVYVAGCWVAVEVLDRTVERYLLSPYITDIVFWGLFSLVPAAALVAWSYGRPGKDHATRAQKIGVPINLVLTAVLLYATFGDKDLQPTAERISMANEEGQSEVHYIPREELRRRLAVFFFDNPDGDPALEWLRYGATDLLVQDLQQDPFISAHSPWTNAGNGFYLRMSQAGFKDGLGVPRSLMRDIALDANRQYFVDGDIRRSGNDISVTVRVWDSQSMELVAEESATKWDVYEAVDAVSDQVRHSMDIPAGKYIAPALPLSETYGESMDAFRAYIEARNARVFDADFELAGAKLDEALRADPGFVLAWFNKGTLQFEQGDLPGGQQALAKAAELDYRLPEKLRTDLKAITYRLNGENDKWVALHRMQAELRDDAESHSELGIVLKFTGHPKEARTELLRSLELDPANVGMLLELSYIELSLGNLEGALDYAQQYQQAKPEDATANITLGDLLRGVGSLDRAEEHYLKAQLLADRPLTPTLRLVDMAARNGNLVQAAELLEQARSMASGPLQQVEVLNMDFRLQYRQGRMNRALDVLNTMVEPARQTMPPIAVALTIYASRMGILLYMGDLDAAEESLAEGQDLLQPPLDQFFGFSEAMLLSHQGDISGANEALAEGKAIIERFDFEPMRFQVDLTQAEIYSQQQNYTEAARMRKKALDLVLTSTMISEVAQDLSGIYAQLARDQVLAGEPKEAEKTVLAGLRLDPNDPLLWLEKARFQHALGMTALANASVQYALAIWSEGDPEYWPYREAVELAALIGS